MLTITHLLHPTKQKLEKSFTVIELLVVIAIIAVLSAIATVLYINIETNAEHASVKANVHSTVQSLDINSTRGSGDDVYTKAPNGTIPEPSNGLVYYKVYESGSATDLPLTVPLAPGADPTTPENTAYIPGRYKPSINDGYQFTEVIPAHGLIAAYYYTYNSQTHKYYEGAAAANSTDPITDPTWSGASTNATLPAAVVGKNYTFNFTSGGNPPPSFSTTSDLPDGLSLGADGKLTGIPSKYGIYSLVVKADNGVGETSKAYSLLVQLPPIITTLSLPTADYGQDYSAVVEADGYLAPTFAATNLPAGLQIDTYTGKITGKPTEHGTFLVSVTATNGAGTTSPATVFGLIVNSAPIINDDNNLGTMIVGQDYTYTVTTTGIPAPTFTATGLPPGITIDQATGEISGKPTGTGGTYDITVTATNNHGHDTKAFTVPVKAPPVITTTNIPEANTSDFYTATIKATANPAAKFSSTDLPDGLILDEDSGAISGNLSSTGTFLFNVKATNEVGNDTVALALIVQAKPVITTTTLEPGLPGNAYAYTVEATGTPAPTFTATGLPDGLSIDNASGLISGSSTEFGTFTVKVIATNPIGSDSKTYTLSIKSTPDITTTNLPVAVVGQSYNESVTAFGRPTPTLSATGLPAGLSMNSDGIISGTPTATGTYVISVTATNNAGTDTANIALVVREKVKLNTTSLASGLKGKSYSQQINASGTPAPTFGATGLPNGLSINASTGMVSGTPSETGSFTVKITATNSVNSDLETYTLLIQQLPVITTTNLPGAVTDTPYSATVAAEGAPVPTFNATGLPAGLSIDSSTGVISGTSSSDGTFIVNVTATNSLGSDTASFGLTVRSAPAITTTVLPNGNKGNSYNTTVAATGVPAPTFAATGLPAGLSINSVNGVISGAPTEYGSFNVTVTVTNTVASDTKSFSLAITAAPVITTVSLTGAVTDAVYSQTVTATGYTQPTFTATGLPAGLTMNGAGTISGTPTADGTFVVSIKATNAVGSDTATLGLTVRSAPIITTSSLPTAANGATYTTTVTATGVPAPTFAATGLPGGLNINASTGVISGTPTASGSFTVTLTATNSVSSASKTLTMVVTTVPVITTTNLPGAITGTAYSYQVSATGVPAPTFTATGLPTGLSMSADGTISGTPSADGSFVVSVKASNSVGSDTENFALVTRSAPAITTTSLPTALTGTAYSYQLTATGVPAPTFAATGLPGGLNINASTGVISGTPTAGGTYSSVKVTVTNTVSSDSKTFTIVVNAVPVITTTSLDSGVVGVAYSDSVAAYSYPTTVTFSATGLPAGLGLNSSTGAISGTPTAAGNYVVAVTATNTAGSSTQNLGLIVKQKTSISTTTLPAGKTGTAYSATVAATGVPAPTFAATGLPAGLSINASTGIISGTPTAAGTYSSVVVTATNSVDSTSKTLTIQINDAPIFTTTSLAGGVVGTAYSSDINASGTPAPTFSATGLPAGLSINSTSGTITGTPTTAGSYTVSVTATNTAASTVKSFGIVVNQIPAITTTSLATGKVGTAYSSDINATGTPAPTYAVSVGALPGGLSLNASTGTISGTPTASGSFTFTIKATNSVGSDTQAYTVAMNAIPNITTTSLAAGKVGTAYSSDVNASGYPSPTFSASGLPAGLSMNSTSGTITGTPTASGAFTVSVTATNAAGNDTNSFGLTVTLVPSISNTTIPDGKVGTAYSLDINSTGYPSPTFSVTGLPSGLSINTTSGLISGTPTGAGGSYSITVKATNSAGSDTLSDTSVIFASVPVISTGSIAAFSDAQNSYTTDINSSGYPAPTYSATGLPTGLSINSTSGTITGTPTEGSYTITVKAANSAGSDTQAYTATVAPYKQSAHTNPGEWVNRQYLNYDPVKTTTVDYDGSGGSIKLNTAAATSSGSTHGQAGLRVDGLRANTYYTMTCYVQSTTTLIYHYTMGTTDANDTGDNTLDTTDSGVWHKISHRWLEGDTGSTIAIGGWNKSTTSEHEWEIDGCTIVRS